MKKEILEEIKYLNSVDGKVLTERFVKYNEEFGEFSAEVCKMIGITHKPYDEDHLKEEMADWIQNVYSISLDICEKQGFDIEEIHDKISEKNKKWNEKYPLYTKNNKL